MDFLTGTSGSTWQPVMTAPTATSSYWVNWRVLLCAVWIIITVIFSFFLVIKYEGPRNVKDQSRENKEEGAGLLYEDEVWRPCLKSIHPAWLLAFRIFAFLVLLSLLVVTGIVDGGSIFYYYTQWTFSLVTIYFGLGSLLSGYGCYRCHNRVGGFKNDNEEKDAEQGILTPSQPRSLNISNESKGLTLHEGHNIRQIAGFWEYIFQIIFQMNAGAVMLTDCVFWFIMVPFLTIKDYNLNFLIVNMHSINAVFLLGDAALNCLRFPWFRIGYFFLWTTVFVIFQWILHACVSLWWPYPFLDLSSSFSPLWYSAVALMHIPCFGIFTLAMKLKHFLLSRWFPESYRRTS